MRRLVHLVVRWWVLEALLLLPALSVEPSSSPTISASSDPAAILQANPYPQNLKDLLTQKPDPSALKLGGSDYIISGPIIEGLRHRSYHGERRPLWKRIAFFPLYLITPLPMSSPLGGGRYFRWHEVSTRPWGSVSAGGVGSDSFINQEPKSALISVGGK